MVPSVVSRSSKCNGDQNVFVEYNFFYKHPKGVGSTLSNTMYRGLTIQW